MVFTPIFKEKISIIFWLDAKNFLVNNFSKNG